MIGATKPLLSDDFHSRSRCKFIPFLGLLFLLSFLFVRRHDFIERPVGTDWVSELVREEQDSTPPLPRPSDISPPKKGGKAPMREPPPGSSDQHSSQAGNLQAGSSASHAAGSPQAGSSASHAGGSPQAGPSGLSPPPMIRREASPEISIIGEDMTPHELLSQQMAYERAQAEARDRRNPIKSMYGPEASTVYDYMKVATCTDPELGFEKQVRSCEEVSTYATFKLTMNNVILIPLVVNSAGKCDARVCQTRDTYNCCRPRRKCNPNYINDVDEGCPANEIVNPYIGAYCRTYPCTIGDIDTCCVDPNSIWQRTDLMRSQYPRIIPDDSAAPASPRVTFGYHDLVWLDISQRREVNGEEWCPLMNFMETWYKGGWSTPAWIRLSKKGKMLYRPAPKEKLQLQSPAVVRPQYRSPQAEEQETYSRSNMNAEDMQALAYGMGSPFMGMNIKWPSV